MSRSLLLTLGVLTFAACGENGTPTQPEIGADPAPATLSLAAASNTWSPKAPRPGIALSGMSAGVVSNSAGNSIVYVFGGD